MAGFGNVAVSIFRIHIISVLIILGLETAGEILDMKTES